MSATGSSADDGLGAAFDRARLHWRCCRFDALSVAELQHIHTARQQVFVIEQQCIYLDADDCDEAAFHLAAWSDDCRMPLAYARLLDPGAKYPEPSIGRVLTARDARGQGLGRELVARALVECARIWPRQPIRISAQSRLERFYAGFGFAPVGSPYLEDGIAHTEMLRPGKN